MKTVLLLAGTAEARALAEAFHYPDARMIASLAGATVRPLAYACETRSGGFGGAEGLREYLLREKIAAMVDATHPFATRISANAAEASTEVAVPLLALVRPAWPRQGNWRSFGTLRQAVEALPAGARVLATTGRKEIGPFIPRDDLTVFLRSIDPPGNLPAHITSVTARGLFTPDAETALMRERGITHLLTRNSGGDSRARLDAAAALDLPVHVVERPPVPAANVVHTVADALHWLDSVLRD